MPATVEELQGLIAGLSEVVKGLATNLNTVATQVGAITAASHGQQSSEADPVVTQNPNLRLPTLQLPTFRQDTTVQDDISYFLERFQEQTAHLTPPVRQALLEQQCIGEWPRSVLSFCRSTEGFTAQTPSQQFDMYVKALREEFEEPKDSKCRRLASELSAMVQDSSESIDQFAFKYKNVLHKLDKLGENLSKACPTYVTSQFISKLQPHIAQHIVLQADQITRLDKAIEAARRIEQSFSAKTPASQSLTSTSPGSTSTSTLADWKPSRSALVTTPTRFNSPRGSHQQQQNSCWICGDTNHISRACTKRTKRPTKKTPEVCRNFNKFISANCEQANNKCSAGRLHKCSNCNKWGCKAVRHKETPPQSLVAGLQSTDKPSDEIAPVGEDTAVFSLPAVTNPAGSLKERHILWTPVISAGEKLPLPLDSCCSVSLVSRSHADLVASKCPKLKYQSLENPIAVSVADSQSQLKAIGTMEIPIQWNNGKESTFQMLVVPGLSWPMLFGENHLHATQALVDHAEPSIHFRHPSMSFKIACSLQNPLKAYGCNSNTHAGVTCLLTGPSFPGYSPGNSQLNRGLNFVSVCLTVGTALMAFSPSDLWVDGQDIQPGVKVLSGPFHMTAATDQLVPAKSCHASVVNIPETSSESSFVQHISDPQPVYAHNTSPIPGTDYVTPFFLMFGRHAPSPEVLSYDLPPAPLSQSSYAKELIKRSIEARKNFDRIKADLKRSQREYYDMNSRDLHIPDGKRVFVRLPPPSSTPKGAATRFLRKYDGPFLVVGHIRGRQDLLRLRHMTTGKELKAVNIEKIVVVPDGDLHADIRPDDDAEQLRDNTPTSVQGSNELSHQASHNSISPELAKVAFAFGQYLRTLPKPQCYASEACKVVYQSFPDARDILNRHGKLKGLVAKCPYLSLNGGPHGGTYLLTLDMGLFQELNK